MDVGFGDGFLLFISPPEPGSSSEEMSAYFLEQRIHELGFGKGWTSGNERRCTAGFFCCMDTGVSSYLENEY